MKIQKAHVEGILLVQLNLWKDFRGFFTERFREDRFQEMGLPWKFVQDNHSRSLPQVLRGLHFQRNPDQGKLVGVTRGRIWDVCVDLRKDSPTFGQYYTIELSDENGTLIWIPGGFAHGFCVLGDEPADVFYKVDCVYNAQTEGGIYWADPDLKIPWPILHPIVSEKDQKLPSFRHICEQK